MAGRSWDPVPPDSQLRLFLLCCIGLSSLFSSPSLSSLCSLSFILHVYYWVLRAEAWASATEELFPCSCGVNSLQGKTNTNQYNIAAVINEHRGGIQSKEDLCTCTSLSLECSPQIATRLIHFFISYRSLLRCLLIRDAFPADASRIALPPPYLIFFPIAFDIYLLTFLKNCFILPPECKHESKSFDFFTLRCLQCQEQCVTHSRHSVDICGISE